MAPSTDDPTKLVFTADTSDLQEKVETVKSVVNDFFRELGLGAEETREVRAQLVREWEAVGVSVDEAKEALERLRPAAQEAAEAEEKGATAAGKAAYGTGRFSEEARKLQKSLDAVSPGLGKNLDSMVKVAAQLYVVVKGLEAVAAGVAAVGKASGLLNEEGVEAVESFQSSLHKLLQLDLIGFSEELAQSIAHTVEAVKGGAKDLEDVLGDAARGNEKAREELRASLGALREMKGERQEAAQEAETQADALVRLASAERESGEVTKQTRDAIEKLVREYEERGEKAPEALEKERVALGILTEAEEDAADAAKKRGDEAEKASEKARAALEKEVESIEGSASALAERTRLFLDAVAAAEEDGVVTAEAQAKIQEKLRSLLEDFKRFGAEPPEEIQAVIDKYGELVVAGDQVADVQKRIQEEAKAAAAALQEQVDAANKAQGDAAKTVADTQARIAELEKKQGDGALTLSEDEELFELKRKLFEQQQALNDATAEAEAVTFDLEQAQADLGDEASRNAQIFADLEQGLITSEQAARLLVAGTEDAKKGLQDLYDEAAAAADGAGDATAAFDEAFSGAADAADEAGASIADAGEEGAAGIGQMERAAKGAGEAVEQLGRKGEEAAGRASFKTMREDVEWLEEHVPILTGLIADLEEAAARVELGGPDDGSSDQGEEATA